MFKSAVESAGYWLKRPLDVLVAGTLLVGAIPLFVLLAVAIRGTSKGPALFRQRRLGRGEVPFSLLKFRSMRLDAEQVGPQHTGAHDARITPLGKLLRKTSLDELPQLWNVLRGDMSLIGPRPYIGFELAHWSAEDRDRRAKIRPGITGLAQVRGRSTLTPERTAQYDLEYLDRCGAALDLKIAAGTLAVVFLRRGTN